MATEVNDVVAETSAALLAAEVNYVVAETSAAFLAAEVNDVVAETSAALLAAEVNDVTETSAARLVTALHVGDLDVSVTEEVLRRLFDQIGDVDSVKICMDRITERSLGYGYVNYVNPQDAEKAIEDLNFNPLNGKHIRISYSNRDATLRKSGVGNIFIKNLDEKIDHKKLHETFSPFGYIISSKVETDASGHSKGYGFVHYTSDEAAKKAIEELNGKDLLGKVVYVGPFMSKQEREKDTKFTNVYVKNLSESADEEVLKWEFGRFGPITSVVVIREKDGSSKCFGFVNFENAGDAAKSIEMLNGQVFDSKKWYVGKAQKKSEREQMLKQNSLGLNNLYVKNLDDKIDDDNKLKKLFSPFGAITSCKVMFDPRGTSKGFGFVAFSTTQEASRAISEMNGKMVGSKPIYVAIAEKREVRQTRLQALYSNVRPNTIVPPVTPQMLMCAPGSSGLGQQVFYAQAPPSTRPPVPQFQYQHLHTGTTVPNTFLPAVRHALQVPRPVGGRPNSDVLQHTVPIVQQQLLFRGNQNQFLPGYGFPNVTAQNIARGTLSVPSESGSSPMHDRKVHPLVPNEALASALAKASPAEQTKMLGENLYPLVEKMEHDMAAKVTGMLLEMDQTEVLNLLDCPLALRAKVIEAMEVLRNAPQK